MARFTEFEGGIVVAVEDDESNKARGWVYVSLVPSLRTHINSTTMYSYSWAARSTMKIEGPSTRSQVKSSSFCILLCGLYLEISDH